MLTADTLEAEIGFVDLELSKKWLWASQTSAMRRRSLR
jgi:hypothetical protein